MKNIRIYGLVVLALVAVILRIGLLNGWGSNAKGATSVQAAVTTSVVATVVPNSKPSLGTVSQPPSAPAPPFMSDEDTSHPIHPTGSPAIQPTVLGTAANVPGFTVANVLDYSRTHHTVGVGRYHSATPPSLTNTEFLTEKELKTRIPSLILDLPDDTLLCYARYSGTFELAGRPGYASVTYKYAAEIFDAHTGNLVMMGVGDWAK